MKQLSIGQRAGFTLIELIISLGVIVMMLAVSLPAFLNFQKDQSILGSAQTLRDAILEANNYALAPRGGEAGDEKLPGADYYRVVFFTDGGIARYRIEEQTNDKTDFAFVTWQLLREGQLASVISYCSGPLISATPVGPGDGIIYSISRLGKIVKPQESGKMSLALQHRALSSLKKIEIQTESGQINISDAPDCL